MSAWMEYYKDFSSTSALEIVGSVHYPVILQGAVEGVHLSFFRCPCKYPAQYTYAALPEVTFLSWNKDGEWTKTKVHCLCQLCYYHISCDLSHYWADAIHLPLVQIKAKRAIMKLACGSISVRFGHVHSCATFHGCPRFFFISYQKFSSCSFLLYARSKSPIFSWCGCAVAQKEITRIIIGFLFPFKKTLQARNLAILRYVAPTTRIYLYTRW